MPFERVPGIIIRAGFSRTVSNSAWVYGSYNRVYALYTADAPPEREDPAQTADPTPTLTSPRGSAVVLTPGPEAEETRTTCDEDDFRGRRTSTVYHYA